ncbi:MAG: HDOD domain-containing protein [Desulfobulbaceae bacterium]|nr:HDOD domain-containing protein [Desulfobulbaceae bacterium]
MTKQAMTKALSTNLSEIFAKMNMGELPAMSANVQQLISLTNSQTATSADIAKVVLQDYSLTNKVLQVVNSAYYALVQPCNSISQAVNILGFDATRDMAIAIALFEDFVRSGVDKEAISKLLARSFLSANLARQIADNKKKNGSSEETFICTLFHNLGKNILCIYLPEKYREIELMVDEGRAQNEACREVLSGLTYQDVGAEVAKFWNLSEQVILSMEKNPKPLQRLHAEDFFMQNLANFANILVDCVCNGSDLEPVFLKYGKRLDVQIDEAFALLKKCVGVSENVSDVIRFGFAKLRIRSRLRNLEINIGRSVLNSDDPEDQSSRKLVFRSCGDEGEEVAEAKPGAEILPANSDKSINDCLRALQGDLLGVFEINRFFFNLLDSLYRMVGFDRVILALAAMPPATQMLHGGFGFGEIDHQGPALIEDVLARQTPCALCMALNQCRDMMIPVDKVNILPVELHSLVNNRNIYLFPLHFKKRGVGLIYLDRQAAKPLLDQDTIKVIRSFRDCAVKAIAAIATV